MVEVSVIVPVFNAQDYLERCINSLINQTLKEIEIILVDDGSSDNSLSICKNFAKTDSRVKVLHQDNSGASAARNAGLLMAQGRYIGFVDADDYVEKNMYYQLVHCLNECNADIAIFNLFTNEKETKAFLKSGLYQKEDIIKEIYPRLICRVNSENQAVIRGAVWCKLFSKKLLDDNSIKYNEELVYNQDSLFSIDAILNCDKVICLSEKYLYHHFVVDGSITKRYIDNLWNRQLLLASELTRITLHENFDFSSQIKKKTFDIAVYSIENEAKKRNNQSLRKKLKNIKKIINDPILVEPINYLKSTQLKRIEKLYLGFIKAKMPLLLYLCAKYRYRNNKMF